MAVVELLFLIVFWTWVVSAIVFVRNTILPRIPVAQRPNSSRLPLETVRFPATDGLGLEGWKIPVDTPARPWIILCHGVGSNRSDLLEIAACLHDEQFNLLLFDFRGHGGSQGRSTSFGWEEQRDLEGALAFLSQQPDVPAKPYGIYGISMGGSVALMVAAKDDRLGAVAADSPYPSLAETLERHLRLMYPLPKIPFAWYILSIYRIRFGIWPMQVSPQASARTLHQPLLLIQGGHDLRTPPEGTRRIVANAASPAELWLIEGAGHLESFAMDPHAYTSRLIRFFHTSLS